MARIIDFKDSTEIIKVNGTIIENSSNSNGEYIKFANGTLICMHKASTSEVNTTYHYSTYRWTYPSAYTNVPYVCASPTNWNALMSTAKTYPNKTYCDVMVGQINLNNMKPDDAVSNIILLAVGKWK